MELPNNLYAVNIGKMLGNKRGGWGVIMCIRDGEVVTVAHDTFKYTVCSVPILKGYMAEISAESWVVPKEQGMGF